jgi:hypothetical protein
VHYSTNVMSSNVVTHSKFLIVSSIFHMIQSIGMECFSYSPDFFSSINNDGSSCGCFVHYFVSVSIPILRRIVHMRRMAPFLKKM